MIESGHDKKSGAGLEGRRQMGRMAAFNAAVSIVEFAARSLLSLLMTPLLVQGLGGAVFGVWKVLERLILYLQVADGRPTQALQWLIANAAGQDDAEQNRQHFGHALGIWLMFFPVVIVLGGGIIWLLPAITSMPASMITDARKATGWLLGAFIITGLGAIAAGVLIGLNLGYKRIWASLAGIVMTGILVLVSLRAGYGLSGVAGAHALASALGAGLLFWALKKNVGWFKSVRPAFVGIGKFLRVNLWYTGWTFINKIHLSCDVILIGLVLSAETVSSYVITSFAAVTLMALSAATTSAIIPGFGRYLDAGNHEKLMALRSELSAYNWLFCTVGGAVILACNQTFVTLWVGENLYAGRVVDGVILLAAVQLSLARGDGFLLDLSLGIKPKVAIGGGAGVLAVGLMLGLLPSYGLIAAPLTLLAARVPMTILFSRLVCARFGRGASPFLLARRMMVMSGCFAAASFTAGSTSIASWSVWIVQCGVVGAVSLLICYYMILTIEERKRLRERWKATVPAVPKRTGL